VGAIDGTSSSTPPHYQQTTIVLFNSATRKIFKKKKKGQGQTFQQFFKFPKTKKDKVIIFLPGCYKTLLIH
jgi:hypothetical protein